MRDPFNLSKPPASNPEPIWIKQPLSYKMRDRFSLSKSRSLKSLTHSNEPPRGQLTKKKDLNIRRNNKKGKNDVQCASSLDSLPFGHPSEKSQCPFGPLAPRPCRRRRRRARAQRAPARARAKRASVRPCAREARAPRGVPPGSPAPQGPTPPRV